jgi:hypothetical protein
VTTFDEHDERPLVKCPQPKSLVQFFRESPLVAIELELERDKGTGHVIEL